MPTLIVPRTPQGDLEHNRRGQLGPEQRQRLAAYVETLPSSTVAMIPVSTELSQFVQASKEDLAEGRVLAVEGEVSFDPREISAVQADSPQTGNGYRLLAACQSAYKIHLEGRAPGVFLPQFGLWPGRYRLYLTPRSNLVVGAEAPSSTHEQAAQLLTQAQGLTDEALASNRQGRMTEAQRQALKQNQEAPFAVLVAFGALIFGGSAYFQISRALEKGRSIFSAEPLLTSLTAVALVIAIPLVHLAQRKKNAQRKADVEDGRSVPCEGIGQKRHFLSRGSLKLSLSLGRQDFDISERPVFFAAVVEGYRYRAWVAPRSGHLLSLELGSDGSV